MAAGFAERESERGRTRGNWIHRLHVDEPELVNYSTFGESTGVRNINTVLFLRTCHEEMSEEMRLHFTPEQDSGCYLWLNHIQESFSEIVHGCHFVQFRSVLKKGLQCALIEDNSPFRYRRSNPEWTALDPVKNDGYLSVVWFGPNIGDEPRPQSPYGNILFRKQLGDYTTLACSKCYNGDLSGLGNVAQQHHDGWHFFFCELYQMKTQVESRFFVSQEPQLPHRLAHIYYPGRPGGTWYLNEKNTGESSALSMILSLQVYGTRPRKWLKHSVAFMIDDAPALTTLDLSVSTGHNHNGSRYINCLKREPVNGKRRKVCPDEIGFRIENSEQAEAFFRNNHHNFSS